ncbi:CfaE/CblD family pilus tip adhesin [Stenotrophomonas sp. TWI587]|uniref:CfaE/CblD family pilus tip adhesin n=1 Tax=Stenotrophomonas sp. TWI587 TaxID=3136783 RepID=UPI00320BB444
MSWRWMWVLMVVMPSAWAQRPPETHPVSSSQNIVMSWDRSSIPTEIELWAPRTLLGYDYINPGSNYGALHLVCASDSDATNGRCPTDGNPALLIGLHSIQLTFVERRSNLRTEIALKGAVQRAMSGRSCLVDFWQSAIYAPWSSYGANCASDVPSGTGVQLGVSRDELAKLVAGVWSAKLELHLQTPTRRSIATYSFNFELTITDHNAVSIYFPAFPNVSPLVALNAGYDPISRTIGGRTVLDMCLYDGLGSQAQYLGVTVRDTGTRPPGPSGFSLWHDTAGNDDSQHLDYTVTLDHNGTTVPLTNGVEEQLHGIDTAQLRLVMLPGMSQPVFCVPTPMTLDIPRVPVSTKRSGIYWGDLKVELRVPTATP